MKVLITGGGGFLGSRIVAQALKRGWEVRVLAPQLAAQGVTLMRGDVADAAAVARAVQGQELVIHSAAQAALWGREEDFVRTNVLGTRTVMDACVRFGVPRLVHTSSPSVVLDGTPIEGADESRPLAARALNHYAATKAAAEQEVLSRNGEGGVRVLALRPHAIVGPKDPFLVPSILAAARAGRLVRVGDETVQVDFTWVEDAAAAHLLAADALAKSPRCAGRPYFISQGVPVRLWEWVDALVRRSGLTPPTRRLSFRAAWNFGASCEWLWRARRMTSAPPLTRYTAAVLGRSHWFNIAAAQTDLGYRPQLSVEELFERATAPADALEPFTVA